MNTEAYRQGDGTEKNPYTSSDGTGSIAAMLAEKTERGGHVNLDSARYDITNTIEITAPCTRLSGEVWSYSSDPNGVFDSIYGTKLKLAMPCAAVTIGNHGMVQGSMIENIGFFGTRKGMDTRGLMTQEGPNTECGLHIVKNRLDQGEFFKLSFCGMGAAIRADEESELDACRFDRLNLDGNANGVWFTPKASFYTRFSRCVVADNPFYGFYADGTTARIHNLEIVDNLFVRNGGAFMDNGNFEPAAVLLKHINNSLVRDNLFDYSGTHWLYNDEGEADSKQVIRRQTKALVIYGNGNRIIGNVFSHMSDAAIYIIGDNNILLNNITDGNVVLIGKNNQVNGLMFTNDEAHLICREQ